MLFLERWCNRELFLEGNCKFQDDLILLTLLFYNFQTGEHYVELYKSLKEPCWQEFFSQAKTKCCKFDIDELPAVYLFFLYI